MTQPEKSDRVLTELFPGERAFSWTDEGGDECALVVPEHGGYVQIVLWEAESEATDTRSVFLERHQLPEVIGWLQKACA